MGWTVVRSEKKKNLLREYLITASFILQKHRNWPIGFLSQSRYFREQPLIAFWVTFFWKELGLIENSCPDNWPLERMK